MELKNEKSYCAYCKKELTEIDKSYHDNCKQAVDKFNYKKLKHNILKYWGKILAFCLSMTLTLGI